MGTHPIFESDFDCLTEMRFSRALRGGSNWSAVPPEKLPPPQLWNKLIPGTPYAEVQKELHKRGLHDPWMRKWYFSYDGIMRRPYTLVRISLLANPGKLIQNFSEISVLLENSSIFSKF